MESIKDRVCQILGPTAVGFTFESATEVLFSSDVGLLNEELRQTRTSLSSGTSDVEAYPAYLDVLTESIKGHGYRNYSSPQGVLEARRALAIAENSKFSDQEPYTAADICITDGATGALSMLCEYVQRNSPEGRVLIPCPSYFAFRLSANHHGLACDEVVPEVENPTKGLVPMQNIVDAIRPATEMIFLTQPTNPTGEVYPAEDIRLLLQATQEQDVLVVFDELFSDLIMSDQAAFVPSDVIANQEGAQMNTICIKSFSKNNNLPGFRIGYAYSTNEKLIRSLVETQENRSYCAPGSNLKELIILDALHRSIDQLQKRRGLAAEDALEKVGACFDEWQLALDDTAQQLLQGYRTFQEYKEATIAYYKRNLETAQTVLGDIVSYMPDTRAAFNTMVRIKDLDKVNQFDFCMNFFALYGVTTRLGPHFGLTQRQWQDNLGFWLRISFSREPSVFQKAAEQFVAFSGDYLQNPDKYISFGYNFGENTG